MNAKIIQLDQYRKALGDADVADVAPLVETIRPLLAGKPPRLISAVLADLLAIWIASHRVERPNQAVAKVRTRKWQRQLLKDHVEHHGARRPGAGDQMAAREALSPHDLVDSIR
jgi:hypothetical protein